eukprot:339119-Amorphochlora_amoeboformis.AAC.1
MLKYSRTYTTDSWRSLEIPEILGDSLIRPVTAVPGSNGAVPGSNGASEYQVAGRNVTPCHVSRTFQKIRM